LRCMPCCKPRRAPRWSMLTRRRAEYPRLLWGAKANRWNKPALRVSIVAGMIPYCLIAV
jgi:hypothetical protein